MPQPARPLPAQLRGRVFTVAEADAAGLTARQRRGPRVVSPRRGLYRYADTVVTPQIELPAVLSLLPEDAAISHVTALQWMGVGMGATYPLHFSTCTDLQTRWTDVILHRRDSRISPRPVRDLPCLGPDRSFVDSATVLGLADLVRVGDWLVRLGLTSQEGLLVYAQQLHIDGVVRAREAARLVRRGSESPLETHVRLLIVACGLPEPRCNVNALDDDGRWLARSDLVYDELKVVVEYDGWHHERDALQRQKDIFRLERLAAAGWTVITITAGDLAHPVSIVSRVFDALRRCGYDGPPPDVHTRLWRLTTRG